MGIFYQVLCTAVGGIICMSIGFFFTWPSYTIQPFQSANTTLDRPMSDTEVALVGSLASIGSLIGNPLAGYFLDVVGRKYCAMAGAMVHVISWSLIAAFNKVEVVLAALFLSGLGGGLALAVPLYISEICQESIRGTMCSGSMTFYAVGFLVSYSAGGCLSYYGTIYVGLSLPIIGLVALAMVKETPMFLMKMGLEEEAAKSCAFYRSAKVDSKEVQDEMNTLRRLFNSQMNEEVTIPEQEKLKPETSQDTKDKPSLWKFIKKSRATRQATFLTLVLMTASILQGLVVVQVYADSLFADAVPSMSSTLCSILLAIVTLVAGLIAAYLTDVAGRRPLLIYASIASGLCCVVLGTQLEFYWAPHWVTALMIYLFTTTFTCGAGTVPFVLMAEVFAPEVKSFMSMIIINWTSVCNFTILFIFKPVVTAVGLGPVFYIFAVICFATVLFCVKYQPETKGVPLDEIQELFNKRR